MNATTPITEVDDLTARAINVLINEGAKTVGDARELSPKHLRSVPSCGPGTVALILEVIHGVSHERACAITAEAFKK